MYHSRRNLFRNLAKVFSGEIEYEKSAKQREDMFAASMYMQAQQYDQNLPYGQRMNPGASGVGIDPGFSMEGPTGVPQGMPVENAICCALDYADEINDRTDSVYPKESDIRLSDGLREDILCFLFYMYDPNSSDAMQQVEMANQILKTGMSTQKFFQLKMSIGSDPEFVKKVPESLVYFVKDDLSGGVRLATSAFSMSRFLVNTFRDLGLVYASFDGVSNEEYRRLSEYIRMMNNYLKENRLFNTMDPYRKGQAGEPFFGLPGVVDDHQDPMVDIISHGIDMPSKKIIKD